MNTSRLFALVALAGLAVSLSALAPAAVAQTGRPAGAASGPGAVEGPDSMPVRRITLYRSGVGAFQRESVVVDNSRVQLKFDVSQINDILKSLQLLDLDGGRIDSVSYSSKDPLARRLSSFSVPIADSPSMPMLLGRLRGSAIDVQTVEGNKISGTILNVENRKVTAGKDQPPTDEPFVVLVTPSGMRAVAISSIASMQLQDKQLADELNRALAAVAEARADRIKTVDLSLSGAGNRRVVVRYVHETPVWKTSYRLIMSDAPEPKADAAAKPAPDTLTLQGWAIVENTTDTDWKDVKLSLVSGRPVSFRMDLSEPLYLGRPDVAVPTIPGVLPRSYAGGVDAKPGEPKSPAVAAPGGPPDSAGARRSFGGLAAKKMEDGKDRGNFAPIGIGQGSLGESAVGFDALSADDLTRYSPASAAKAGEIGEVFFYEVQNPVTVERQRSAMIPFLGSNIEGRRVSIYNMADRADHPMRGVQITNTSDLQLLPGPLAVFDGAAYAGDATINQVSPGDKRLLAYALDLDVVVTTKPEGSGDVVKLRIVDGLFEQTVKTRDTMTYTFANKDLKRSRTIVVEHPKLPAFDLKAPDKPVETTQDLYRFEVTAPAGKQGELAVVQEQIQSQRVGITSFDMNTLMQWRQQGKLSEAVLGAVKVMAGKQSAVNQAEREAQALDKQLETNTSEQTRISTTMQRLPQNSDVYTDYMKELKDLNTSLKSLRQKRADKGVELEAKRAELNDYVRALNVE